MYLMKEYRGPDALYQAVQKAPHGPGFDAAQVDRYPLLQKWSIGGGQVEYRLIGPAGCIIARKRVIEQ